MATREKLLQQVLRGTSDSSIPFTPFCAMLRDLGFEERVRGSHHIFTMEGVAEILNLQPKGSQAKAYQVRQVRGSSSIDLQEIEMTEPRYEMIIYWSAEDDAFVAEVPELPGCAADGPTYEAALRNAQVIIAEWIETAKELGRPIPEPRGRLMFA